MNEEESKQLAQLVSCHLRQLSGDSLAAYLYTAYKLDTFAGLSTGLIYAVEVAGGDFSRGDISSVPVRWWEVNGQDCCQIPLLNMAPFNAAHDAGNVLWPYPIISYYAELPLVLSKEGVGQTLKLSRTLSVVKEDAFFRVLEEQKRWLFKG